MMTTNCNHQPVSGPGRVRTQDWAVKLQDDVTREECGFEGGVENWTVTNTELYL